MPRWEVRASPGAGPNVCASTRLRATAYNCVEYRRGELDDIQDIDGAVVDVGVGGDGELVGHEDGEGGEHVVAAGYVVDEAEVRVGDGGVVAGAVGVARKGCRATEVSGERLAEEIGGGGVEAPVGLGGASGQRKQGYQGCP